MTYKTVWTRKVLKQLEKINDKKFKSKLLEKITQLKEDPFSLKFEKLVGELFGLCSTRLNIKDRPVYEILKNERVIITYSVKGHYDE